MGELPEGWAPTTLGEVAEIIGGGTPPASDPANFSSTSGIPWLTPADLSGFRGKFVGRGARNLTDEGMRNSAARLLPAGSVLMSSRAPIGYLAIAANPIATNQGFKSFVCTEAVRADFLFHWLGYIRPVLEEMASGTTFLELSGSRAKEVPLRLPPLAEQERIVEKVEALLTHVQTAHDVLERVQPLLDRFRQSVLEAAALGDLTKDWRDGRSLSTARTFLDRLPVDPKREVEMSESLEDLPALPPSWTWAPLGSIASKIVDGVHKTPEYQTQGVPFVTVRNLTAGPGIDLRNLKYIRHSDHEEFTKRTHPERGDLLISKDGTLGVVRAIRSDDVFSIFVSVALIKPADRRMTDFLELALSSPPVQQRLVPTGSGLQHLHLRDLRTTPVPVPSPEEQDEVVRRVNQLFRVVADAETRLASAVSRAHATSGKVLAKAFAGELVPTEAEDARTEGRGYESGEELLERIRAERAVNGAQRSARKPRAAAVDAVKRARTARRGSPRSAGR